MSDFITTVCTLAVMTSNYHWFVLPADGDKDI
jgi:hypothetical protein